MLDLPIRIDFGQLILQYNYNYNNWYNYDWYLHLPENSKIIFNDKLYRND